MATDTIRTVNVVQATLIKCKPRKIEKLIVKPIKLHALGFKMVYFVLGFD